MLISVPLGLGLNLPFAWGLPGLNLGETSQFRRLPTETMDEVTGP